MTNEIIDADALQAKANEIEQHPCGRVIVAEEVVE